MAVSVPGFDTFPLDFDRTGAAVDPQQLTVLETAVQNATDVLVISHGWNNNMQEADQLYQDLLTSMGQLVKWPVKDRVLKVCLIHWPSKRFTDDDLIPGGVASTNGADLKYLADQLLALRKLFDGSDEFKSPPDADKARVFDRLVALLPQLEFTQGAQDEFGRLLRSIMPGTANEEEPVLPEVFFSGSGADILNRLSMRVIDPTLGAGGAASVTNTPTQGGAASLGNLFSGIKNGAQNFLNLFTYYEMKNRAGIIGAGGVHSALLQIRKAGKPELRLHLAGHSFGGRLVSAALACNDGGVLPVNSICLLQAAFSHFGFSVNYDGKNNGFFRDAVATTRLLGPMAVTFSVNDKAVGIAYPLASRLLQQIAASLGDAGDPYGGIGRNGALKTPEANSTVFAMLDTAVKYQNLSAGKILNVKSDEFISGHSDVRNKYVAHLVLSAMGFR
jgi:hypothetical protein